MLADLAPKDIAPPAQAPEPPLKVSDIVDPPLPPVANIATVSAPAPAAVATAANATGKAKSSGLVNVANVGLSLVAIMVLSLFSWGY